MLVLPFPQILGTGTMAPIFIDKKVNPQGLLDLHGLCLGPQALPALFRSPAAHTCGAPPSWPSWPWGQCQAGGAGLPARARSPGQDCSSFPWGCWQEAEA